MSRKNVVAAAVLAASFAALVACAASSDPASGRDLEPGLTWETIDSTDNGWDLETTCGSSGIRLFRYTARKDALTAVADPRCAGPSVG